MPPEQFGEPVVVRRLDNDDALEVQRLIATAEQADVFAALSDQLAADLEDLGEGAPSDRTLVVLVPAPGELAGVAIASRRSGEWTMQLVIDPRRRGGDLTRVLLGRALEAIEEAGGGRIDWWVFGADGRTTTQAAEVGLQPDRELLLMRRSLPASRASAVATRGMRVGQDEQAWLAVNNRAFAGHHEQGNWTMETLRQRMRQPWFEPDDVRLHERDGRLAAFCWTKIHPDERAGEIYVIGVDPDFQGLGLGKELTLAGLDRIVERGMPRAMLYVAAENSGALALYERLGFTVHRTDRAYVGFVG